MNCKSSILLRKMMALSLSLSILFSFIPTSTIDVYAEGAGSENFEMSISDDDGLIASYDKDSRKLSISGSGRINPNKWIEMAKKITHKSFNSCGWKGSSEDYTIEFNSSGSDILLCDTLHGSKGLFENFKGDIIFNNSVNTSGVKDMSRMFFNADKFDQNLSNWDTSSVTNMNNMFYGASSFSGDVSTWTTSSVTNMNHMFCGASSFSGDVSTWTTSNVTDMSAMFEYAKSFNQNLSSWDTSNVQNMQSMFEGASLFNGDVSSWKTSNVTDMSSMFQDAKSFNRNLSKWVTSSVTDMSNMFYGASSFNGDVSTWNTSKVMDMSYMFYNADKFNQNLSKWNTSSVTNMNNMFYGASSFNGDISSWNTSNITDMSYMFANAKLFNQNLSTWDTSSVTNMRSMFSDMASFNGDISSWDTSNVTEMTDMFARSSSFNGDISSWDTSNVTDMSGMFKKAKKMKKIILTNRGEKENTKASGFLDQLFKDTSADIYKFKGLTSFTWEMPFNCSIKNVTEGTVENKESGSECTFLANDEYLIINKDSVSAERYTVTFKDYDGTVLNTEEVEVGGSVTAPEEPTRAGYTFTGWDKAYENVTEDLEITAEYEKNAVETHTVIFKDYDGTVLKTEEVEAGNTATAPEEPTRAGYTFTGWDKAYENVTEDLEITAEYEKNITKENSANHNRGNSGSHIGRYSTRHDRNDDRIVRPSKKLDVVKGKKKRSITPIVPKLVMTKELAEKTVAKFEDLTNHWGKSDIVKAIELGFLKGVSERAFEPNSKMSRASLYTLISKMSGKNLERKEGEALDASVIRWVKKEGISDGANPNASVSREQLATMLYRYVGKPKSEADLSSFNDESEISSYAVDAMKWAVKIGLIKGSNDGKLNPKSDATRAEVAAVFVRFLKKIEDKKWLAKVL